MDNGDGGGKCITDVGDDKGTNDGVDDDRETVLEMSVEGAGDGMHEEYGEYVVSGDDSLLFGVVGIPLSSMGGSSARVTVALLSFRLAHRCCVVDAGNGDCGYSLMVAVAAALLKQR